MATTIHKSPLVLFKLAFGLLAFSSLATEVSTLVQTDAWTPDRFFAYFTVQTNLLLVVSLLVSAVATAANAQGAKIGAFRSAVGVYILIVGLGFAVLLSGLQDVDFTAVPWNNTVLHYIMPAVGLVDLIIDRAQLKTRFGVALLWLLYPLAYGVIGVVRGGVDGWYPYPFLNPTDQGYGPVLLTMGGLVVLGFILTWVVTKLAKPARGR